MRLDRPILYSAIRVFRCTYNIILTFALKRIETFALNISFWEFVFSETRGAYLLKYEFALTTSHELYSTCSI